MTSVKRTHWFRNTLIVLIICGLAGTILAAVMFHAEGDRSYASAFVQFSFKGADEGIAPNGYRFDISGIITDEVLDAALELSGLSGVYTAEQLRENLNVTGEYPDKIAEQMTAYISLLDSDTSDQAAVLDYHATKYSVTLYKGFDRKLDSGKLNELLESILRAFRDYFTSIYSTNLVTKDYVDYMDSDYIYQIEGIGACVSQQTRYAEELANKAPDFMMNRKGFEDIATQYRNLKKDIDNLGAVVTLNSVSKDRKRLRKQYELEILEQQSAWKGLTEQLEELDELMKTYERDSIIYVSANGSLQEIGSNAAGIYDKLVAMRRDLTDQINDIESKLSLIQARLDDLKSVTGAVQTEEEAEAVEMSDVTDSDDQKAIIERQIGDLITARDAVVKEFEAMLEAYTAQEINDRTVYISGVKYIAPSLFSGRFVARAIKTAGPFCAVGFMVCMAMMISSRRKEEKRGLYGTDNG